MALIGANPPSGLLYQIGRAPVPLAWPEWAYVGASRFDDPGHPPTFRVLYTAEQRLAAFLETLQKWRPSLAALTALESIGADPGAADDAPEREAGTIPADWRLKRGIAALRLLPDQSWLDLREHETRETLRTRLATLLHAFGYDDFDLGDVLSRDRRLTQAIARFAYDNGFQGIAYQSRFDNTFDCWAIFEGARIEPIELFPITRDDPDLIEAAERFRLILP